MPTTLKTEEIKLRVSLETKQQIIALAEQRGESESLIVREAIALYLKAKGPSAQDDFRKAAREADRKKKPRGEKD